MFRNILPSSHSGTVSGCIHYSLRFYFIFWLMKHSVKFWHLTLNVRKLGSKRKRAIYFSISFLHYMHPAFAEKIKLFLYNLIFHKPFWYKKTSHYNKYRKNRFIQKKEIYITKYDVSHVISLQHPFMVNK